MSSSLLLAILCGATVGVGLWFAVAAFTGLPQRDPGRPTRSRSRSLTPSATPAVAGIVVGVLVLLLTRWVVAAVGLGLLVAFWDRVVGRSAGESQTIARLEALASWTESLRDTIAGAIGLEQAIPATAATTAPSIRPSLNLLVDRLRIREPLPKALLAFADDLDDSSADVICSALVLNARLRGPGLRDVLTALAVSTREELDMRRRIEASRRSIRRSVRIILVIVLGMMGMLAVFNRQYLGPYDSVAGQGILAVVALLLLGGLLWLRRLGMPSPVERFLVPGPGSRGPAVEVEGARP